MSDAAARTLLRARGISKRFRVGQVTVPVFGGLDLDVAEGEMLMLVGASGTGKSTLLHILGAMDTPDSGTVELGGENIIALSESRRARLRNGRIGFIFQFFHLLPEFSALENVMLPALYGRSFMGGPSKKLICEKAQSLLADVGLGDRMRHRPNQLSGGQMQRVAFARALMNDPDMVFADEPTGNLDEESSLVFFDLIAKFNAAKGRTFVIATHNMELASRGSRVLRLQSGTLVREK